MEFRFQNADFRFEFPRATFASSRLFPSASRRATRNSPTRRAISLIEVLISMFVLLFGLMGVAAIFPVGNHFVVEGEKFDLGSSMGQNAFEELKARGLLRPQFWHYAEATNNIWSMTRTRDNDHSTGEYETLVMQPLQLAALVDTQTNLSGLNPGHGLFNLTEFARPNIPFGPGHAFVIDPIGTAAGQDEQLPNLDLFPYSYLSETNVLNPWLADELSGSPGERVPLQGARWPVRRISVLAAAEPVTSSVPVPLMRTPAAETIFRLRDDLTIEQPDQSDIPSRQLWRTFDDTPDPNNPAADADDTRDDHLLARQYRGDYSWLATIVPTSEDGLLGLQPTDENYGEIACDLSVVVFRKREFTPSSESENRIDAELLPGGELVVYSPKSHTDPQAKEDVDRALDGVRPGNWMTLMGVDQSSGVATGGTVKHGQFVMKWYRILALDTDESATVPIDLEDQTGGVRRTVMGRHLMLAGPDWPEVPLRPSEQVGDQRVLPYVPNLRAGFFPGAISVVTKPIRMEHSSLWSLE